MEQKGWTRKSRAGCSVAFGVALALAFSVTARGQDFSAARLKDGEASYAQRRYADATDALRIAAFGLLDQPILLSEALVYLALAQDAAGRREDAITTLARFAVVERRFSAYAKAALDNSTRSDFEARFRTRLPASVMASAAPPPPIPPAATPARPYSSEAAHPSAPPPPAPTVRAPPPEPRVPIETRVSTDEQPLDEGVDTAPKMKKSVRPVYPRAALQAGVGGTVLLKVLVSERGEPLQVEVVRGIRSDLAESAVQALKSWTFDPGLKNGIPVRAWTTVAIPFSPARGPAR